MKLPHPNRIRWNYKALAFALPCLGVMLVMLVSGYTPFGHYSMLYSDMYHQYFPFFNAFRHTLRSGGSLLYHWNVGLGLDYLGLISYYLASPLNLLSVLVPESWLLSYFSLLVPVKLGLASLFFAVFLNKLFDRNDFSVTLFGCCYGLCAWALGYQWNIMWLDTFALLPLAALGTVRLLRDKKVVLYTLILFLSVFSNYYIGFFTCIFIALLFVCYEICRFSGFRRLLADLGRIALFSLLAIGMTAVLELPTLAALQTTQSSVNNFPTGFRLNIADENTWRGLLDAMRQVAGNQFGGLEPTFKEGLPNLYCGVGTVMLSFLFLTAKKIPLRDKLCSVFLLLFFVLSFIIRQLDYIWHGFHFTNMIPYRFSFLYSFVLLTMAYRAWLKRRRFRLWQVITAALLSMGLMVCSDQRTDPVFLIYNLGLMGLYVTVAVYQCCREKLPKGADAEAVQHYRANLHQRFSTSQGLLAGILVLEMTLNLINFGLCFTGTNVSNYPRGTTDAVAAFRYIEQQERDTPFYRTEVTQTQTLNDGALNLYRGVSTFTSSANVSVTKFMKGLGFAAKETYNRYCYEIGSPVADLFLGIKYLVSRSGTPVPSHYLTEAAQFGEVTVLQNSCYLPLGFLAEPTLADLDFTKNSGDFSFQNKLFQQATGLTGKVWQTVSDADLKVLPENVTIRSRNNYGLCSYETGTGGGKITYQYTVSQSGYLAVLLDLGARNDFTVLVNGATRYSDSLSLPQIAAVGTVQAGDVVEIRMDCDDGEAKQMTVTAAILDDVLFRQGYEILSESVFDPTVFTGTTVSGSVTCGRSGLLYTSVAQNGNWQVTVDGQPAEITLVGGAMIGVMLTPGTHQITLTYHNAAFSLGWKISLLCAALFLAAARLYRPRRKKGKFEK